VSIFDARRRIREAGVFENYHPLHGGGIDEGEELHCFVCDFVSRQVGMFSHAWGQTNQTALPPIVELCEFCHLAAQTAQAAQTAVRIATQERTDRPFRG